MKKLIAFLLITILVVSLFACGGGDNTTSGDGTQGTTQGTTQGSTQGGTQGGGDDVTVTTLAPGETDVDNDASWPSSWN